MARLPYPDLTAPDTTPLVERIVAERGKVLNLYRMLMHSPVVAEGWLKLFTAIRHQASLSGRLREMVILRIAVINGADYEFQQHLPIGLREGLTGDEIKALQRDDLSGFADADRAIFELCDTMTRDVHVPEAIFAAAAAHLPEKEMVELVATIAGYNLVSRFLEAMAIDPEEG